MGYIPSLYRATKAVLGVFALGVASTAMLLYRYQRSLVYPSNFPAGSRTEVMKPDQFGVEDFEELHLKTPDGERLHAYLLAQRHSSEKEVRRGASSDQADVMARRPTVLFLHANAGNMGHRLPLAAVFYKRFGCNVFMLSYRGYGLSTGEPSEVGIRIDAQTALDYIRSHDILSKTVIVAFGQSIGGAVAIDLASRNTKTIGALVLENTFLSIPELIPHVLPPIRPFAFLCREYWPSGRSIAKMPLKMPILFLSGRKDELVPPQHMDTLFERCSSQVKVWKQLNDGTHNDTCVKPGYFDAIGLFLATYVIPRTSAGQEAADAAMTALSDSYTIIEQQAGYRIEKARGNKEAASASTDSRPSSMIGSDWVEMSAQDADTAGPALSVAPQDAAKEKTAKGNL